MGDLESLTLTRSAEGLRFEVRAKPRARKSALLGVREGKLEIALAAQPIDGAANDELRRVLARALRVPGKQINLVRGESGRAKLIEVLGVDAPELLQRLRLAMTP